MLLWQDKIFYLLSLFQSFCSKSNIKKSQNTSQAIPIKRKIKLSILSKYFICPLSLTQQINQWIIVLKYIYGKFKFSQFKNQQKNVQKQKNLITLLQAVKSSAQQKSFKFQYQIQQIDALQFYQCVKWAINNTDKTEMNQLVEKLSLKFQCGQLQKMIKQSQVQQLILIKKDTLNQNQQNEKKKHSQYLITPQIVDKTFLMQRSCNILPSRLSFSYFIDLKSHLSYQNPQIQPNIKSFKIEKYISQLSINKKSVLKKLYKAILDNPSHQQNTLNEFYSQMKFEEMQKPQLSSLNSKQIMINKDSGVEKILQMQKYQQQRQQQKISNFSDKLYPQFYAKVKNFSKSLNKLSSFDLAALYSLLKHNNIIELVSKTTHLFSYQKFCYYSQLFITQKVKENWIINYLQTKKQIVLLKSKKSPEEQICQYEIHMNVLEEHIICNLWNKPISANIQKDQKIQILDKLTGYFNYHIHVYKKWFTSEIPQKKDLLLSLCKIQGKGQFFKKLNQVFNNEIEQVQCIALYELFSKNKKNILHIDLQKQRKQSIKVQNPKLFIVQALNLFKYIRKHVLNKNIKPLQEQSLQNKFSYVYNMIQQLNGQTQIWFTYQKFQQKVKKIMDNIILDQQDIRNFYSKTLKQFLNKNHIKIQTFFNQLAGFSIEELSQPTETNSKRINLLLSIVLSNQDQLFQKNQLLNDLDLSQEHKQRLIKIIIDIFMNYDYKKFDRSQPLNLQDFKNQIFQQNLQIFLQQDLIPLQKQIKNDTLTHKKQMHKQSIPQAYEQIYKQLDIMGIGQVNLNDIKLNKSSLYKILQHRQKRNNSINKPDQVQSFIKIDSYLQLRHPYLIKNVEYLKANETININSQKIIKQLIKVQQSSLQGQIADRVGLIQSQKMTKIISHFTDQQHIQFILEFFDANKLQNFTYFNPQIPSSSNQNAQNQSYTYSKKKSNFIVLTQLIQYILGKDQQRSNNATSSNKKKHVINQLSKNALQILINWVQQEGGIQRPLRIQTNTIKLVYQKILGDCLSKDIRTRFQHCGQLVIEAIVILIRQISSHILDSTKDYELFKELNSNASRIRQTLKSNFSFYQKLKKQSFSKIPFIQLSKVIKQPLTTSITQILEFHYTKVEALHTTYNTHVKMIKQLSLTKYKLLEKMYIACSKQITNSTAEIKSKYKIFEQLISSSQQQPEQLDSKLQGAKNTFDLIDFCLYINVRSVLSLSKYEVNQIFKIIDTNSDYNISFKQFVTFWMAIEQVVPNSIISSADQSPQDLNTVIKSMKSQLRSLFVLIFQKDILSSNYKNPVLYSSILKAFNTSNKQKINKLIEILFEDSENDKSLISIVDQNQGKGYGPTIIINNIIEITLDKDRLKIIKRVIESKQSQAKPNSSTSIEKNTHKQKGRNLALQWISQDLYDFIYKKTTKKNTNKLQEQNILKTESIIKYLLSSYPNMGFSLIQNLFQDSDKKFTTEVLLTLLKPYIVKGNEWKNLQLNLAHKNKNIYRQNVIQTLKTGDKLAKTFHFMTKLKIQHFCAQALAFRINISEIKSKSQIIQTEIGQIQTWIAKQNSPLQEKLPLIYSTKQNTSLPTPSKIIETKLLEQEMLQAFSKVQKNLNLLQSKDTSNFMEVYQRQILSQRNPYLQGQIKQTKSIYKIKDKTFNYVEQLLTFKEDTRFKSNNQANFSIYFSLYSDSQLSIPSIIDIKRLKQSKGQSLRIFYQDKYLKTYKPFLQTYRPVTSNFSCIPTLIRLSLLNYMVQKKYNIIGSICNLQNIYVNLGNLGNQDKIQEFKIKDFYQCCFLGADGNYAEGFDLVKFYSQQKDFQDKILPLAPEVYQNVYTFGVDSYNFGTLIFLFYTGMTLKTLRQKQMQLIKQSIGNQSKEATESKKFNKQKQSNRLKGLVQPSSYQKYSFINAQCQKTLRQLQKKVAWSDSHQKSVRLEIDLIIYTLIYKCTKYNWYQRPQMHQIVESLQRIQQTLEANQLSEGQFLRIHNEEQVIFEHLKNKQFSQLNDLIKQIKQTQSKQQLKSLKQVKSTQQINSIEQIKQIKQVQQNKEKHIWSLLGIERLKEEIGKLKDNSTDKKSLIIEIYQFFNMKVKQYVDSISSHDFKISLKKTNQIQTQSMLFYKSKQRQNKLSPQKNNNNLLSSSPKNKNISPDKFGNTIKSSLMLTSQMKRNSPQKLRSSAQKTFLQSQTLFIKQQDYFSDINENSQKYLSQALKNTIQKLLKIVINHTSLASTKQTLFICLCLFKDLLNQSLIKKYIKQCDQKWDIQSFNILKKIQKVNKTNKIQLLPKNGIFYNDFYQLMQQKITLSLISEGEIKKSGQAKIQTEKVIQHQSSKVLALNHILSILLSNNLSKIYALYQSKIVQSLYIYMSSQNEQIKLKVVQIYRLISRSLKVLSFEEKSNRLIQGQFKKIDQVYKTMMVIFDSLKNSTSFTFSSNVQENTSSPLKKSNQSFRVIQSPTKLSKKAVKSTPVVNLLQYVQNYYTIAGYESVKLIRQICQQQMCHLFSLIAICEQIYAQRKKQHHMQILANLSSNRQVYSKLNNHLIGIYSSQKLKVLQKNGLYWKQINQCIQIWQKDTSLISVSAQLLKIKQIYSRKTQKNIFAQVKQCIQNNFIYFKILSEEIKGNQDQNGNKISQYNSFNQHIQQFLKFLSHVLNQTILQSNNKKDQKCLLQKSEKLQLSSLILEYLEITISKWVNNQNIIKILIQTLNQTYNTKIQELYLTDSKQKILTNHLLKITQFLMIQQPKLMIDNGFIHVFTNVLKKQFERMQLFFDKKIQKIRLIPIYYLQSQWRTTILQAFLTGSKLSAQIKKQINKQLSNLQISKVIFEQLYLNETLMDLRFYQSFEEGVPFRYCRPFKSEALLMIGIILKATSQGNNSKSGLSGDILSRLIPLIKCLTDDLAIYFTNQKKNSQNSVSDLQILKIVEIIWIFSQISQSGDERLKYEFINCGTHQVIKILLQNKNQIKKYFPKLHQTVTSNVMVTSSKVFQKSQLFQSRRSISKTQTFNLE